MLHAIAMGQINIHCSVLSFTCSFLRCSSYFSKLN